MQFSKNINMRRIAKFFCMGLVTLTLLLPLSVMGQFERKVSVYAFVGESEFGSNAKNSSDANNALKGYKFSPTLGAAAFYALDGHLSVGGSLRFLWATKSEYRVFTNSIGADIKYNILPSDKKISPFVFFEANLAFNSVKQASHSSPYYGTDTAGASLGNSASITGTTVSYKGENVWYDPAFGMFFGGGVDIKAKETLNFFVQAGYNTTYLQNAHLIKEAFAANSNLSYLNISVGVRLNLFQKKTFY